MAITLVGVGAQSANSTLNATPGAQYPVGYTETADDFAVVILAGRPTDTSIPTPEAGWTQRATALREVGANDLRLVAYYKKLVGGDGVPNFTVTTPYSGNSAGMSMFMAVFRGVDTTNPWDVADVTGTNAAADQITPTGITPVTDGAWVLSVVATADDNALALLAGSEQGFTVRAANGSYDTTVGGDHAVGLATKEQATAGAVTCPTWDQTLVGTDAWAWLTLALRPAAGGGDATGTMNATSTLSSSMSASGTQKFNGTMNTSSTLSSSMSASGTQIFNGTMNTSQSLGSSMSASGTLIFTATMAASHSLSSSMTASGTNTPDGGGGHTGTMNASSTLSSSMAATGNLSFNATMAASSTLSSSMAASGSLIFTGSMNAAHFLGSSMNAAGIEQFNGSMNATHSLSSSMAAEGTNDSPIIEQPKRARGRRPRFVDIPEREPEQPKLESREELHLTEAQQEQEDLAAVPAPLPAVPRLELDLSQARQLVTAKTIFTAKKEPQVRKHTDDDDLEAIIHLLSMID